MAGRGPEHGRDRGDPEGADRPGPGRADEQADEGADAEQDQGRRHGGGLGGPEADGGVEVLLQAPDHPAEPDLPSDRDRAEADQDPGPIAGELDRLAQHHVVVDRERE